MIEKNLLVALLHKDYDEFNREANVDLDFIQYCQARIVLALEEIEVDLEMQE